MRARSVALALALALAPAWVMAAQPAPPDLGHALALAPGARLDTATTAPLGERLLWAGSIVDAAPRETTTRVAALLAPARARIIAQVRIRLAQDDDPQTTAVFGAARPVRIDGAAGLVLDLASLYADREASGFLVFLPDGRVLTPPDPAPPIRPLLRGGEQPFIDDQDALVGTAKVRIVMATSPGGLGWTTAADGSARLWMAIPIVGNEAWMARHRMAVAVYRVSVSGFALDPAWNNGRPWVSPGPADPDTFDPERIAREGLRQ